MSVPHPQNIKMLNLMYLTGGMLFVGLQDPHALEDLTGLTELHSSAAALAMMESDEETDEESGGDSPAAPHQAMNAEKRNVDDDWLEL